MNRKSKGEGIKVVLRKAREEQKIKVRERDWETKRLRACPSSLGWLINKQFEYLYMMMHADRHYNVIIIIHTLYCRNKRPNGTMAHPQASPSTRPRRTPCVPRAWSTSTTTRRSPRRLAMQRTKRKKRRLGRPRSRHSRCWKTFRSSKKRFGIIIYYNSRHISNLHSVLFLAATSPCYDAHTNK